MPPIASALTVSEEYEAVSVRNTEAKKRNIAAKIIASDALTSMRLLLFFALITRFSLPGDDSLLYNIKIAENAIAAMDNIICFDSPFFVVCVSHSSTASRCRARKRHANTNSCPTTIELLNISARSLGGGL